MPHGGEDAPGNREAGVHADTAGALLGPPSGTSLAHEGDTLDGVVGRHTDPSPPQTLPPRGGEDGVGEGENFGASRQEHARDARNGLHGDARLPPPAGGGGGSSETSTPLVAAAMNPSQPRSLEVSAGDVWRAFRSTRPSLSSEDRERYDSAYRKFRGGSRPADFNPVSSVDDGTLRTALK